MGNRTENTVVARPIRDYNRRPSPRVANGSGKIGEEAMEIDWAYLRKG